MIKVLMGLGAMVAVFVMIKWVIVIVLLAISAYCFTKLYQLNQSRKSLQELELEIWRAKADLSMNRYLYEGDIYGEYKPATMP